MVASGTLLQTAMHCWRTLDGPWLSSILIVMNHLRYRHFFPVVLLIVIMATQPNTAAAAAVQLTAYALYPNFASLGGGTRCVP